jgi:hypothetical protein
MGLRFADIGKNNRELSIHAGLRESLRTFF